MKMGGHFHGVCQYETFILMTLLSYILPLPTQVVNCYLECYHHTTDSDQRRQLTETLSTLIWARPRYEPSADYFTGELVIGDVLPLSRVCVCVCVFVCLSYLLTHTHTVDCYASEVECLTQYSCLLTEMVTSLLDKERHYNLCVSPTRQGQCSSYQAFH